jgi:hypothetical protein
MSTKEAIPVRGVGDIPQAPGAVPLLAHAEGGGCAVHDLRHYADGRIMCPAMVIRLVGTVPVVVSST